MPRHQSSHRKESSQPSPQSSLDALRSRPFAPVLKSQEQTPASPAYESQLAEFSVLEPGGSRPQPIQAKLTIGAPGDKYEQEADRVAAQVVQHINSPTANQPQADQIQCMERAEEDELQMKPKFLQREVETDEEDEVQMKPLLQRQGRGAVAASDDLESAIQQSRGGGQPLADSIREPMEQAFGGVDFSGVKVHTDAQSAQLNRSIQAKAFTTGQDIYFRQGAYEPGSRGGQTLLAHELTHVIQQNHPLTENSLFNVQKKNNASEAVLSDIGHQNIVQCSPEAVNHDDTVSMGALKTELDDWKRIVQGWSPSDTKNQYISQIDGAIGQIEPFINGTTLRPYQKKVHFGKNTTPNGVVYLVFRYKKDNDNVKLEGIVKHPKSSEHASKEDNTAMMTDTHNFLSTQTASGGKLTLDADTDSLVDTYYKVGYVIHQDHFAGRKKPDSVDTTRWTQRRPNSEERQILREEFRWPAKLEMERSST